MRLYSTKLMAQSDFAFLEALDALCTTDRPYFMTAEHRWRPALAAMRMGGIDGDSDVLEPFFSLYSSLSCDLTATSPLVRRNSKPLRHRV